MRIVRSLAFAFGCLQQRGCSFARCDAEQTEAMDARRALPNVEMLDTTTGRVRHDAHKVGRGRALGGEDNIPLAPLAHKGPVRRMVKRAILVDAIWGCVLVRWVVVDDHVVWIEGRVKDRVAFKGGISIRLILTNVGEIAEACLGVASPVALVSVPAPLLSLPGVQERRCGRLGIDAVQVAQPLILCLVDISRQHLHSSSLHCLVERYQARGKVAEVVEALVCHAGANMPHPEEEFSVLPPVEEREV